MNIYKKASITELHWKDIRTEFAKKNARLACIIDEIDPGAEYTLFKANYPFGSEVLRRGLFFIPNQKNILVPLNSHEISDTTQKKLNYNLDSNPVGFVLNGTAEIFVTIENHTSHFYGLISPGRILGTWRVLNPKLTQHPVFIWDMTAGARSLCMLPKISEAAGYNKLRRAFQLHTEIPKDLLDHWKIFREIANHPNFDEEWVLEILFFSKKWFEHLNDKKWVDFKLYLLEQAFEGSEFFRNQFIWDIASSLIQKQRKIKPGPNTVDNVKHLLAIGVGALPGFVPAINNEAGPINKLQEVFANIYQLKDYPPVIMQPALFSLENSRPVYYSLQYPTSISFSPKSRENSTKIFTIYEIKLLLNKYLMDIHSNTLNLSGTSVYNILEKIQYDFFHTDIENYKDIRLSEEIPTIDPSFTQTSVGINKNFPSRSAFVRGCIRVTPKIK